MHIGTVNEVPQRHNLSLVYISLNYDTNPEQSPPKSLLVHPCPTQQSLVFAVERDRPWTQFLHAIACVVRLFLPRKRKVSFDVWNRAEAGASCAHTTATANASLSVRIIPLSQRRHVFPSAATASTTKPHPARGRRAFSSKP